MRRLAERNNEVRDLGNPIRKWRVRGAIVARRISKKKPKLQCCLQNLQRVLKSIFGTLIPLLVGLLQVHGQGLNKSLFETHPANMWIFLLAIFLCCPGFVVDTTSQNYNTRHAKLVSFVAVISGSVSVASLLSIFVPLGRLRIIPWTFVPIISAAHYAVLNYRACRRLHQLIVNSRIFSCWHRLRGRSLTDQPRPPV